MLLLSFLIFTCLVLVSQGHPVSFEDEKENVSINLQLGLPKNYLSGKVRLELEFGRQCLNQNAKITTESDEENVLNPEISIKHTIPEIHMRPFLKDCNDIPNSEFEFGGVFNITMGDSVVAVNCQILPDGRKFLVFQRRMDGSVDFYRNWFDYTHGFGDVNGEFWLGNLHLHHLTSNSNYTLRVELNSFNGTMAYAEYEHFLVGDQSLHFPLYVSDYFGTAGDSLSLHNGAQFSTEDVDNDYDKNDNCARLYMGGWWYTSCHYTNLNGLYVKEGVDSAKGINWFHFMGYKNSMKSVQMMMTRK